MGHASMKAKTFALLTCLVCIARLSSAQSSPQLANTDRVRLAEAFRLADKLGNRIWPGWSDAPFAVLLVTPEYEFLIRHPRPSADFERLGHDALLPAQGFSRQGGFSAHLS